MQSLLTNPSLMDCRRLYLRDYEVWINIGVHEFEKKGEQRVKINVDLYVPLALSTPTHDQLDEVLDYDFMRRSITERANRTALNVVRNRVQQVQISRLAFASVNTIDHAPEPTRAFAARCALATRLVHIKVRQTFQ